MRHLISILIAACLIPAAFAETSANYASVKAYVEQLAKEHPQNAQTFILGRSGSGDDIIGLKIGHGPVKNMVVSTHHGNEYGSTEVAKAFAASVVANPIEGQTMYVIPVLNISGYNARDRYEEGQDPNRDYPGPCGSEGPFKLKDTAALASFIDREGIVASATLHTFYPAVVYPWGLASKELSTAYDDLFKSLVAMATQESGYQTGNSTEVIYPANGTYEDYAFWKHGIWSILFELGYSHTPTDQEVADMQRVNVPGLRRMMENAPKTRAANHDFKGTCDASRLSRDKHDE